jgi:DNA helicase HerA-like ATPase
MNDMAGSFSFATAQQAVATPPSAAPAPEVDPIGFVFQISGSSSQILIGLKDMERLAGHPDTVISMTGQVGSQVKMKLGTTWVLASVRTMILDRRDSTQMVADIDFLGEGNEDFSTGKIINFRRGVTRYPSPGTEVYPVSSVDMDQIYAASDRAHVQIGTVYPTANTRAALYVDALLGKHFALLGSTGTGKSTSAALILHRICDISPKGHIVMIDPHGEYAAAFAQNGAIYDVNNLALPYWLMNFEEHCEVFVTSTGSDHTMDCDILAKCLLAARSRNRLADGMTRLTVDSPVPYLLSDLTATIANEMGKLEKGTNSLPYMRLKTRIDEIKSDPRYSFMFSGMLVADTMKDFLAKVFRLPSAGKPISTIDTSAMPSEITSVVVSVLSRLIFDYAIWARSEPQRPILLVCEEAHRYIPNTTTGTGQSVRKILERIAKEGRKYGVSLGLITQRPSDLAEGVLSQCGTIISLRLNNDRDQAFVRAAMPEGSRGFLDSIPALRNRECIICGEGVAVPIRVALDELEAERRPASSDPSFSELWQESGSEDDILGRTITRWRNQGR